MAVQKYAVRGVVWEDEESLKAKHGPSLTPLIPRFLSCAVLPERIISPHSPPVGCLIPVERIRELEGKNGVGQVDDREGLSRLEVNQGTRTKIAISFVPATVMASAGSPLSLLHDSL
jgi:hypothetical protein